MRGFTSCVCVVLVVMNENTQNTFASMDKYMMRFKAHIYDVTRLFSWNMRTRMRE